MATRYYQVVDESGDIVVAEDGSLVIVGEEWSWTQASRPTTIWTKAARAVTTWVKDVITD